MVWREPEDVRTVRAGVGVTTELSEESEGSEEEELEREVEDCEPEVASVEVSDDELVVVVDCWEAVELVVVTGVGWSEDESSVLKL